jgi:pilus assembly protein CpaB
MKWAVIGLCLLGSVAAASAALLVNALRAQSLAMPKPISTESTVLFANKSLPAMTVVESSFVESRIVPPDQAPPQSISSPVAVVGKVLTKPILAGQPFTASCFTDPGSAQQLAAVIPKGKRAVGISVTNYAGLNGLLYPGSMVDVMVSLKPGDGIEGTRREAFTATLLPNIQVLAIEQQTVVSPPKATVEVGRSNENHCVTLLVDSDQAKALQLAMEQGTLSLALRNPLDMGSPDQEAFWARSLIGNGQLQRQASAELLPAAAPATAPAAPPPAPHWDTIIMRGSAVETKSFPLPESGSEN